MDDTVISGLVFHRYSGIEEADENRLLLRILGSSVWICRSADILALPENKFPSREGSIHAG